MRKYPSFITNKLEIVYAINSLHITLVNFKGNNIYIYIIFRVQMTHLKTHMKHDLGLNCVPKSNCKMLISFIIFLVQFGIMDGTIKNI